MGCPTICTFSIFFILYHAFKLLVLRSHDLVWFLICCQRIFAEIAQHVFMRLAPPYPRAKEEFCEAGFECVPASSGSLPQEATSAPGGKNSTNASETLPTVNALNQTHKNTSAKTPSLRGMRIGHIGGIGHPGFHPVHPYRPYRPIHPYYHPWRPYRPYYRPWLYPRRERVWGNAITCPCGSLAFFTRMCSINDAILRNTVLFTRPTAGDSYCRYSILWLQKGFTFRLRCV